ncbi:hypothetical protein Q7P37_009136 [Cladosporium fusiforme]
MTTPHKHHASSILPAQLAFLAIYNPTLGPTEETFADQLVFWYSRKASEARRAEKSGDAGSEAKRKAAEKEEEHERLRQIGLAQGMVGFAKTFSEGEKPVDSVETEKSRVVLRELENGWWILASIDLTRLPAQATAAAGKGDEKVKPGLEYSSREVSPPALLVQQLLQAHSVFLLHHGPSLDELFVKLSRDKFCSTLERYWMRFARGWDVLLHGNPTVDTFGAIKLAAGGELGVGVGEEEWGSGEREVLEDMTRRTEGLVDMVVARFGEPATEQEKSVPEDEALPWLGSGNVPSATDGIIFGGIDKLNRHSLRGVSNWMQQIYAYGDYAYGVRDNPSRERRRRRRRNPPPGTNDTSDLPSQSNPIDAKDLRQRIQTAEAVKSTPAIDPDSLPEDPRPQMYDRVASHDHATGSSTPQSATHPGIPPPIVSAAEQALTKATEDADRKPAHERTEEAEDSTTMGIPDQYMKYMTFGLSSLAKSYSKKQGDAPRSPSDTSKAPGRSSEHGRRKKHSTSKRAPEDNKAGLSHVDPLPEGEELRAKIAQQINAENQGYFIIGLKGELAETPEHDDDNSMTEGSAFEESDGSRILLRTVQVELAPKQQTYAQKVDEDLERGNESADTGHLTPENPITKDFHRLRVLVYVHRPFIFAFLFEQRTSSLSYTGLYKSLHNTITPIHKRLLASTSPETIAQRLEASHPATDPPIFSLLYDPTRLTLHSTIPNIPIPGAYEPWTRLEALNVHASTLASLAATSGPKGETALERTSKTARGWWVVWLRLPPSVPLDDARPEGDSAASPDSDEANPTARKSAQLDSQGGARSTLGIPSTVAPRASVENTHRVAILVRKAGETGSALAKGGPASGGGRMGSGMWSSLGIRGSSGAGGGGGAAAAGEENGANAGALGGFGVDARKYVEGLLSLNR